MRIYIGSHMAFFVFPFEAGETHGGPVRQDLVNYHAISSQWRGKNHTKDYWCAGQTKASNETSFIYESANVDPLVTPNIPFEGEYMSN